MNNRLATFIPLLLSLVLVAGCGMSDDNSEYFFENYSESDEGKEPIDEDVGITMSPIRDGAAAGSSGAVEISSNAWLCSGFMVGTQMVITAAHCFDSDFGNRDAGSRLINLRVSYAATGTRWFCMTDSPTTGEGKCRDTRQTLVVRDSSSSAATDFALVFYGGPWENVSADMAVDGLYAGPISKGLPYHLYGRGFVADDGTGSGIMRYVAEEVDWVGTNHFYTIAEQKSTCEGDSGGPYFRSGGGFWAFGVHSNASLQTGHCSAIGAEVRGSRLTDSKMDQINAVRAYLTLAQCTRHSSSFPDHWVCP